MYMNKIHFEIFRSILNKIILRLFIFLIKHNMVKN